MQNKDKQNKPKFENEIKFNNKTKRNKEKSGIQSYNC